MKKGYILLKADGSRAYMKTTKKPTLAEMQAAVGGYIQPVSLKIMGRVYSAVVNEEGLCIGLPYNAEASEYYQARYEDGSLGLVGDVMVLVGYRI